MTTTAPEQRTSLAQLDAFRALSDPLRLAIVDELRAGPLCGRELRERLQLSAPLLSHHLRVLRNAGLVQCERVGRCLEVKLDPDGFERLEAALPERVEAEPEAADAR
jgi:ArsR family transcriptional regulator